MPRSELARAEWEASTESRPRVQRQGKRELIDEFRQYGNALAVLKWGDFCTISKIESLRPGTGAATRLIEFIKSLAQKYQITLFGNATAYLPDNATTLDNFLTQDLLEGWYKRHGFQLHRNSLDGVEIWYPNIPTR